MSSDPRAASIGIDFGTSNTVVAVKRRDGTMQCVAPERGKERTPTTQYLVDVPDAGRWAVYEQNLDLDRIDSRPGDTVWISWDPGHAFGVRP